MTPHRASAAGLRPACHKLAVRRRKGGATARSSCRIPRCWVMTRRARAKELACPFHAVSLRCCGGTEVSPSRRATRASVVRQRLFLISLLHRSVRVVDLLVAVELRDLLEASAIRLTLEKHCALCTRTCVDVVASSGFLSSRTRSSRGKRKAMPLVASTRPAAARCTGEMDRSAALISHTSVGLNHTSGVTLGPSPTT